MPGAQRVWESQEPLSDLVLWADWDLFGGMIESLRLQGFQHGTVPIWNFTVCGGHPELADPQSWAWLWPSALGYLLPPNAALFAIWIAMTLVGFTALRALLLRWTQSRLGAAVGAAVFALSGCFAARFNAGHVSYAFFHLVPVLMLWFEVGMARGLAGGARLRDAALGVLLSFLFMSGALPHALLHFYPAFALYALLRLGAAVRAHGGATALRAASALLAAHALGALLAAYKIWPIVRWQLDAPRTGIFRESYSLENVLENTLMLVPDYFSQAPLRSHYPLPNWGYNAFVGPLPWLLAIAVLIAVAVHFARGRRARVGDPGWPLDPFVTGFAAALIGVGFWLSIGNANPLGLASVFEHVPVLEAIRGFNRYQTLIAFGVAILCAQGFPLLAAGIAAKRLGAALQVLLAVGCIAPVLVQTSLLVWNLPATPRAAILASYPHLEPAPAAEPPRQIVQMPFRLDRGGHQAVLLEAGYWIANCYSPVTPARGDGPHGPFNAKIPLSSPEPVSARITAPDRLVLEYPAGLSGDVRLHLRMPGAARLDVPFRRDPESYDVVFRAEDLRGGRLELEARYAGPAAGARASAVGLALTVAFLFWLWRAQRGNTTFVSRSS